ncbi:phage tail protein [Enterobacter quasiroggenkampii]|uniref:phage tail protein n=1 Tax=Enterobacter quasiroggenkampii TaxID=2497436 RepID=UPI003753FE96
MTVKYKTVITKAGAEKLAAATVPNGKKVNFTAMAVGDGGGTLPVPDAGQTKLVNEVWRHGLNKISQDNKKLNYVIAELLIPPEAGGFWMREMGLYDDTGTLIAVGNMAESYKPLLEQGSGRAQTVRMVIMVSDIASVELSIDTSTVMATQEYVDEKLEEHEQSRRHPDATLTAKGFTQLSSATDSVSETLAATPKAVKAAYDLARGKYTAQDATTGQKGIVQLSSATDSASEALAATPKAVKTVSDDLIKLRNSQGTAATKNAQEAPDDITPGRLLVNGGAVAIRSVSARAGTGLSNADALPPNSVSFCYSNATNSPGYEATILDVGGLGGYRVQYAASYSDGGKQLKFRALNGDNSTWGGWQTIYHTGNKPNAVDVNAVSAFGGDYNGTFRFGRVGTVPTERNSSVLISAQPGGPGGIVSGAIFEWYDNSMAIGLTRGGGTDATGFAIWLNNRLLATVAPDGAIASSGNIYSGQGVFESGGAVRVYSSNNPPPQQDLSPYARQDWTLQYFVRDVAMGAEGAFTIVRNAWQRVPPGCAMTGYNFEGDNPGGDTIFYRPIQKYLSNIGWITVGHTA